MNRFARARKRVSAALALVIGGVMALSAVTAAQAAPPYETEATVTSIAFTQSTVESGQKAELTGAWSLPNNPTPPAGFVIDLPDDLQGLSDSFALHDAAGEVMGTCTVGATQIVCDFDADYLAEHPRNLKGTFDFWVEVKTEITETTEMTYDFGDVDASVTVTPGSSTCPDCTFEGMPNKKSGKYNRETDTIAWAVDIKAPREGMADDQLVTVRERLGENQEWARTEAGAIDIFVIGTNKVDATGKPTGWTRVTSQVGATITEDGDAVLVSFRSQGGWFYSVHGNVKVTDGGAARTYTNEADITIAGETTRTVTGTVTRQGGGGVGGGDRVGDFSITKEVRWSDEPIAGLEFEGTYTVTAPDGEVTEGTFQVAEGDTWKSPEFDAGSRVHVEEIVPTGPAGIDWAEPQFSQNDFALGADATVAVTLTNEATVARAPFSATKVIEGDGADLVARDTTFTLAYEYPAGDGFAAGSGTLVLPADGAVVTSSPLPVGAVLSLSELAPVTIDGATWETPRLSATSITIGRGEPIRVTVTNTLTRTPPPTPPVTPPATPPATPPVTPPGNETPPPTGVDHHHETPPPPGLAITGGEPAYGILALGALLVGLGVWARTRRTARAE